MSAISLSSPLNLPVSTAQFVSRLDANHNLEEQGGSLSSNTQVKESNPSPDLAAQRELQFLKIRDREVKAHELAHASVGGRFASGANFSYQKGSDGVLYAVAGEVAIDTGVVSGNPQATLEKALVIQRAALAPANPSSQDRAIAAAATAMAQQARVDIITLNDVENMQESKQEDAGSPSLDVFA